MKIRRLGAAALVAVLGVAAMAPTVVDAADEKHELQSSGTVVVEEGKLDKDKDPIVDPENPDESIDPSDPTLEKPSVDPGAIGMLAASPLDFGTLKVSNATQTPTAKAYMAGTFDADGKPNIADWNTATDDDKVERGNIVVWGDLRGNDLGYTVTATMTRQFTHYTPGATDADPGTYDTSKVLNGSTIDYTNLLLATRPDAITEDTTGGTGMKIPSNFKLGREADGSVSDSVTVATAEDGFGSGYFTLEFGQSSKFLTPKPTVENPTPDPVESTADKSVTLTIPQATSSKMQVGTYVAEITWTMNYTA